MDSGSTRRTPAVNSPYAQGYFGPRRWGWLMGCEVAFKSLRDIAWAAWAGVYAGGVNLKIFKKNYLQLADGVTSVVAKLHVRAL